MAQSAMLRFLRKKMKVIFWFTAVVFIGLVIFGWGAGVTGRGKSDEIDANIAGKVDDHEISYLDYQEAIQREYEQAYNEGRAVSESESELIRDRTFYTLVNRYLANQEMERKAINKTTNALVFQSVKRDPPPAITQNPNFRAEDGSFNRALFEQYLANPQVDWLPIEMMVRSNLPFERLQQLVSTFPLTTNVEAQIEYVFRNEQARGNFVKYDPFAIEEIAVDTSDVAVEEYYESHKEDYRTENASIVNHALIPILPSVADTQEAYALAETLLAKLKLGDEFEYVAENYSDDVGTKSNGGILGWFGRGRMVEAFEEAAFSADSGEIVGPVLTDFGFHIIKVLGKQGEGDSAMVNAAHILLNIEPGIDTQDSVKDLANRIIDEVEDGENFFEVCEVLGIDSVGQSAPITDKDAIPAVGFNERIRTMITEGRPGVIDRAAAMIRERPLLEGLAVVQLHKKFEKGVPSLIEVRDRIVTDMIMEARKKVAMEKAKKAAQLIASGSTMPEAAEVTAGQFDTTGTITRYDWIEGVGMNPKFTGTLFGLTATNQVSRPIVLDDGSVYLVQLEEKIEPPEEEFNRQAMQIKSEIANYNRKNAYERWFNNLRENSKIIDNRYVDQYSFKEETPVGE